MRGLGEAERAEFPFELVPKIAELGISGGTVQGYGSPGMSAVAAGLVAAEWARADGSVGTFYGVHSFLAMQSIALLGNEEQRERWLPAMARMEKIGAFGLTEPQHGSDAVGLESSARRDGNSARSQWSLMIGVTSRSQNSRTRSRISISAGSSRSSRA